jgi:shikimate dehydrogenase
MSEATGTTLPFDITGKTRIMFILACPVEHVRGSALLTHRLRALGHDVAVAPLHVAPEDLERTVAAIRLFRNVIGFGVTIPHKIAVCGLLDELLPQASQVGSVNFVHRDAAGRLRGENLDGSGFVEGARQSGIEFAQKRVLLLGAGGAGRSIAFSIAAAGAGCIGIANRTPEKADELARAVRVAYPHCDAFAAPADPAGFDAVVNTTSVGMKPGDPLPIDPSRLTSSMSVSEIILAPEITPLVEAARSKGCRVSLGSTMLAHQLDRLVRFLELD